MPLTLLRTHDTIIVGTKAKLKCSNIVRERFLPLKKWENGAPRGPDVLKTCQKEASCNDLGAIA